MFAKGGANGGDTYCIPMIFVLSSSTLEQLRDIDTTSPGQKVGLGARLSNAGICPANRICPANKK